MSELEIAFIAICIFAGAGAIAYAGLRTPGKRHREKVGPDASSGDPGSPLPRGRQHGDDTDISGDGGSDGGGGD